jgi:hypothetical protein
MADRMAGGQLIKIQSKIEFNGGALQDIQHSYVTQQDNFLRMFKLSGDLCWL